MHDSWRSEQIPSTPDSKPNRYSRWGDVGFTPEDAASHLHLQQTRDPAPLLPRCGIHPYGEGTDPKGNRMAAINLRCIEGIDLPAMPLHEFNGRAM